MTVREGIALSDSEEVRATILQSKARSSRRTARSLTLLQQPLTLNGTSDRIEVRRTPRKERQSTRKKFKIINHSQEGGGWYSCSNEVWQTACKQYVFEVVGQQIPGWPDGTVLLCRAAERKPTRGLLCLAVSHDWNSGRLGLGSGEYDCCAFDAKDEGLVFENIAWRYLRVVGIMHMAPFRGGGIKSETYSSKDGFVLIDGKFERAEEFELPSFPLERGDGQRSHLCHEIASMMSDAYHEWRDQSPHREHRLDTWAKELPRLPETVIERERISEVSGDPLLLIAPKHNIQREWSSVFALTPITKDDTCDDILYVEYDAEKESAFFGYGMQGVLGGRWANDDDGMYGTYHRLVPVTYPNIRHDFETRYGEHPLYRIVGVFSDYQLPRICEAGFKLSEDGNELYPATA